jgi:hypothetical protein
VRDRRERALPRVRELLARVDHDRLAQELAARRMLPLIGSRAIEAGADLVPDSFRAAVERALSAARGRGLAYDWATRRVVAMLGEAGIRTLPLKGSTLAADLHGDVGLRATSDVDLLVPRDDLFRASRLLVGRGFSPPSDVLRENGLPDLHLGLRHPKLLAVELHWRVHWDDAGFSADMLERAAAGGDGLLRPAADDLAASLLLFHARDGFHGLRLVADLATWWDRHGCERPPAFLEGHCRRYPDLRPALSAAARVAEEVAGVPATGWLGDGLAGGRRVEIATRLADWTQQGDRDQLRANISLVGGLLGAPHSGGYFVRRELLPHRGGAFGRPAHFAKMCARYVLALWRVRGNRHWSPVPTPD